MKFLCGNCKAKYQIADDKIAGRTLRMKCRRCNNDIIIRGDQVTSEAPQAQAVAVPAPAKGRPVTAGPAPVPAPARPVAAAPAQARRPGGSALAADFRRSMSGGQAPAPAPQPVAPPPLELWHVAINDVPVGPIRKEEVARKIQTGAVNGDSLCWREGFDDWRPVKDVAELAALLRRDRPPAPSRPAPVGRGIQSRTTGGSRPRIRPVPAAPRPSARPASERPAARAPQGNVVPIGGRQGAGVAPVDDFADDATAISDPVFPDDQQAEVAVPYAHAAAPAAAGTMEQTFASPSMAPAAPATYTSIPPRRRRGLPVGAWIAIAGAGAFGMTLAAIIGTKMLATPGPAVADNTTAPTEPPTPLESELVLDEATPAPSEEEEEVVEAPTEEGTTMRPSMRPRTTPTSPPSGMQLSAAERALIERFGQPSGEPTLGMIDTEAAPQRPTQAQLTAAQLSTVVGNGRRSLQRCYEMAIRGMGDPPAVRSDVSITVAGSGRVTRVNIAGRDVNGLNMCVERAVRSWLFPPATGQTATQFPLVFQPQG